MNPRPKFLLLHDDIQWAVLIAHDIRPVGAEWTGARCLLHFPDTPEARALLGDLAADSVSLNARTLVAAFKEGRKFLRDEVDKRDGRR